MTAMTPSSIFSSVPLWLVDAFTRDPFRGNPAGVCLVQDFPEDSVMQSLAFELHWSETAFIKLLKDEAIQESASYRTDRFHIRWFSPRDEAPICGHATLAAAHFLFESGTAKTDMIHFHSKAGPLTVTREISQGDPWLLMDFPALPVQPCSPSPVTAVLQQVLGCTTPPKFFKDDLIYIALLPSEEAVQACFPRLDLLQTLPCRALSITALSSQKGTDFVSRYFAPRVGIPEDPVCGSAHCRLAPLWAKICHKTELWARQISARGGLLRVTYNEELGRVSLASQATTILKGTVTL